MVKAIFVNKTIRSRLVLHSAVIVTMLLLSLAATFLQNQKVVDRYSTMAEYQLLLSRIYLRIADTNNAMEKYLESGEFVALSRYKQTYPLLIEDAFVYSQIPRARINHRIVVDFRYMIQTYVEFANDAVSNHSNGELEKSTRAYLEARRVQSLLTRYLPEIVDVQNSDFIRIRADARRAQIRSLALGVFLILFVGSLSIFLTLRISVSINRPVSKLVKAARAVAQGMWETRVDPIIGSGEMKLTGDAFNNMLDKIHRQMIEIDESRQVEKTVLNREIETHRTESLLKEAQLKTLQARINPHFLFNTLNMITQSAYLEGSHKTAEITEAFASLMRFNLDHFDGVVSLKEEFSNLEDYLFLQRIRYDGRVEIECSLAPDLEVERLPGLVLQPLVENSITHGMSDTIQNGRISVNALSQGDHYTITVADNGSGMTAESMEAALRYSKGYFPAQYGKNIGIRNVLERLYLYSDSNLDVQFQSQPGEGTEISINLPRGLRT